MHLDVRNRGNIFPGAHRLQMLLGDLDPFTSFEVILVTGTNGKGTVCAFLEQVLRQNTFTTGLYTSPHLVSVHERIRVCGQPISEGQFNYYYEEVKKLVDSNLPDASLFEILTAIALYYFKDMRVEIAVVEIGLGGLYDSTNALSPSLSIVTGIGLDHTEYLGDSEFKIAADKSFISRRNKALVVGKIGEEAWQGVKATSEVTGSIVYDSRKRMHESFEKVYMQLLESENKWIVLNKENLRTVLWALDIFFSEKKINIDPLFIPQALMKTVWPGRFDIRTVNGTSVIFDVAHNVNGANMLKEMLEGFGIKEKSLILVYASFKDKRWETILPMLSHYASTLIITELQLERAVPANEIFATVGHTLSCKIVVENCLDKALSTALSLADVGKVLVTGSLALVGEAMELLKISPFEEN